MFDVGASEGLYAEELRKLGYKGRIISFEPRSDAFARLQARSSADERWECIQVALGAKPGTGTIHLSGAGDSSSFLPMLPRVERIRPDLQYIGDEIVQVQSLDDIYDNYVQAHDITFMKLDVQGYEQQVLSGASGSMGRITGLQLELSMVPLYDGEALFYEISEQLYALGFSLVSFEPNFYDPQSQQLLQADGLFFRVA